MRTNNFHFQANIFVVNYFKKTIIVLLLLLHAQLSYAGANFGQIKTFGYDYLDFNTPDRLKQLSWLAKRHDWIIGGNPNNITYYNTVKNANPNTKIMNYLPMHSISPEDAAFLENWAIQHGKNVEEIYYHYYKDTTLNVAGGPKTFPGFDPGNPDASAATLREARARTRWNGGWPAINPSSRTFRDAFLALAAVKSKIAGTSNTWYDGLFLDTFHGLADEGYDSGHIENTIELRNVGTDDNDTEAKYARIRQDLTGLKVELDNYLKKVSGNPSFLVLPNAGHIDAPYYWFSNLYNDIDAYPALAIEFLIQSTTGREIIPRLQQAYDDMIRGRQLFLRSQTNVVDSPNLTDGFKQFILAAHYLINNPNAYFMYHLGNPNAYNGYPRGDLRNSHWNKNMEVNFGGAVTRNTEYYWGDTETNRFFNYMEGQVNDSKYTVLGREFSNGLVLARFGRGGLATIGSNKITITLDREYSRLLPDNTYSAPSTTVILGESEGAILIKNPLLKAPASPNDVKLQFNR